MAEYRFLTEWRLQAPAAQVYAAIVDSCAWPDWWDGLEKVEEISAGDKDGIGSVHRYTWKSASPYRLRFDAHTTHIVPEREISARVEGDLIGSGHWQFAENGDAVIVQYHWQVRTGKFWMNLIAPLARPLFRRNHHLVMESGARGLSRHLQAPLLQIRHMD